MEENKYQSDFEPEASSSNEPPFMENNSSSDSNSDDFNSHPDNGNWEEPVSSSGRGGRRLVIYVIIIILIIFGAFWFLGNREAAAPSPSANNNESASPANSTNENSNQSSPSSIKVSDQPAAGVVIIDSVTLDEPSWIAVEEDRDGERGNVLGALWLPAGTHTAQSIDLLRFTAASAKYYAVVRRDEGEDHLFNYQDDEALTNTSGSPIMAVFRVTSEE